MKTFLDAARKRPELSTLIPTFQPNVPQVFVKVDRDKVIKQGIDLTSVYQTLQTFMGGFFVNYFNRFGRTWQTYIEAEGDYRTDAKNVGQFFVRNSNGDPVPLDAISTIQNIAGPGIHVAVQRISLGTNQRRRRAWLQLESGDASVGRSFPANDA